MSKAAIEKKLDMVLDQLQKPALIESVTKRQLAEMREVSMDTVYRWIRDDPTFPAELKDGKFAVKEINQWLQSR